MKTMIIVLVSLLTQIAAAGDASFLKSLGFSPDGKYYAFVQDRVQDGSGFYEIEMGLIDVANNKYVGRASINQEQYFGEHTIDMEISKAQELEMFRFLKKQLKLKQYGFTKTADENVLVSRPHTDLSQYLDTTFSTDYWVQSGANSTVPTYRLSLKEVPAPKNLDDFCYDQSAMIDLRMTLEESWNSAAKSYVLQKDKKQPKVRRCAFDYSIRKGAVGYIARGSSETVDWSGCWSVGPNNR